MGWLTCPGGLASPCRGWPTIAPAAGRRPGTAGPSTATRLRPDRSPDRPRRPGSRPAGRHPAATARDPADRPAEVTGLLMAARRSRTDITRPATTARQRLTHVTGRTRRAGDGRADLARHAATGTGRPIAGLTRPRHRRTRHRRTGMGHREPVQRLAHVARPCGTRPRRRRLAEVDRTVGAAPVAGPASGPADRRPGSAGCARPAGRSRIGPAPGRPCAGRLARARPRPARPESADRARPGAPGVGGLAGPRSPGRPNRLAVPGAGLAGSPAGPALPLPGRPRSKSDRTGRRTARLTERRPDPPPARPD